MSIRTKPDTGTATALTARDLASALMGKPRAAQSVHISATVFSGSPLGPRYVVLVVPEGSDTGELYEVYQRGLDALRDGMSPEELELEPYEPEADDEPEFTIRDHTRAMARSGAFGGW